MMMKLTFWGTRGSIPVSGAQFMRYGGATTCLELEANGERVIVDCGTGLAALGQARGAELTRATVYQTHMHWDHVQGFPFFAPLFNPRTRLTLRAVPRQGLTLRQVLSGQMSPPTFPVGLDIIPAQLTFEEIEQEGSAQHGALRVSWAEVWHPGGSTAYRFELGGAAIVVSGDIEVQRGGREALLGLARGADVLVMDAQYFEEEYAARRGFGHSTPQDAVALALEAGVKRLILTHHDPSHHDDRLAQKLREARAAAAGPLVVDNAYDRMEVEVACAPARHAIAGLDRSAEVRVGDGV